MFPQLSPTEVAICLIPAVIVIIIAVIVVNALRRKPTKTTENDLRANPQTGSETGNASEINPLAETSVDSQNGLASTSLVISILAILVYILFGPTWANCMGPLAMIMGAIALLQIRKKGGKGKGTAIAGIVIGTLPFIITIITILFITADVVTNK